MKTELFITENGSRIFYRKAGAGPVLLLLHGFPEDGSAWENIWPVLANHFTVIIPDIPGSGRSQAGTEILSMEYLASVMNDLMIHEEIHKAVIAGHSMGGYLAMALAAERFPWIQGVSLVHSSAAPDTEEKVLNREKAISLIERGGKEAFIQGMVPNLFSKKFRENHPEVLQRQKEKGMEMAGESMIAFYKAMIKRKDNRDILRQARFPVQWIIGKEDEVMLPSASLEQSRLASINFVSFYEHCGHMSMLEQPEKLAQDLNEFTQYCFNH